MNAQDIIATLRDVTTDRTEMIGALEDGEVLALFGITDQEAVEDAHAQLKYGGFSLQELGDIAGRFGISDSEAQRIVSVTLSEADFIDVWMNESWWSDDWSALQELGIG